MAKPSAPTPADSHAQLIEIVLPNDANVLGNMLGGRVMHHMDMAGFLAANRHCRKACVTAAMEHLDFLNPVRVGEAIVLDARVVYAGRTSMDVLVEVQSENLLTGERKPTAKAIMTFVAVDGSGRPVPVPPLRLGNADDRRLHAQAVARRHQRRARRTPPA